LGELADRRIKSAARLAALAQELKGAEALAEGKACVYATGSFGRQEAGGHSDLDLFIVGRNRPDGRKGSSLRPLDEICVKARLIEVTRRLGFPDFTDEGRYLAQYSVADFISTLGTPEDDVTNTFTARLLLLLESSVLVEPAVYAEVLEDVIAAYWRDYEDHSEGFIPAFLANDILRLWRTFCVNYEARTTRDPAEKKAKGKLKNYKLKHSRLLTCYSAILYLLAAFRSKQTVTPADALSMIRLTPTKRLDWLCGQPELHEAHEKVQTLIAQYERFLLTTNNAESELVQQFMDKDISRRYMLEAAEFGDTLFYVFNSIGGGSRFHRLLVV
jgi:hypothetical protein